MGRALRALFQANVVTALVTKSTLVRVTATIVVLVRGGSVQRDRTFASESHALAWIESLRPGAHLILRRLEAIRELKTRPTSCVRQSRAPSRVAG